MFFNGRDRNIQRLADQVSKADLVLDGQNGSSDTASAMLANAINQLGSQVDNIFYHISSTMTETTKLDSEISKIKLSTQNQKVQTERIAASAEEMSKTIIDIANNASTASTEAQSAVKESVEARRIMDDTVEKIDSLMDSTNELKSSLDSLHGRIQEVEDVTGFISDVADQTNLLALNAAIEAARAGEHGRGFAVVADEVRKLAERTMKATTDIGSTIGRIRDESAITNNSMNTSMEKISSSREQIASLNTSFENVVGHIEKISDDITMIAATVEQQSSATEEVAQRVDDTLRSANLIDHEAAMLLHEVETVMDNTQNTVGAIEEIKFNVSTNTLLERVKADHRLWVKRLYRMYHGIERIESVGDHHTCRLGQWYYSDASAAVSGRDSFHPLEAPHRMLHEKAAEAVELFNRNEMQRCLEAIMEVEEISHLVVGLIDDLKTD